MFPTARGDHVEFEDAAGATHAVVLIRRGPFREWRGRRKLERWARQGRAVYVPPLTFVQVTRRR